MIFCGIDPGQKGAVVFLSDSGEVLQYSHFQDIKWSGDLFKYFNLNSLDIRVVIEKLWGMPLRGSAGNWSLGYNCGQWKLLLELAGVSYVEVAPPTWQKEILKTTKEDTKKTKIKSLDYVNKRFPNLQLPCKKLKDIDLFSGVSDAICMALYCRQLHLVTKS